MNRLLLVAALVLPSLAGGQAVCATIPDSPARWGAPLDRMVRIEDGTGIREAIDQAGRQAGVAFVYSVDLLPSGRIACGRGMRLGDALTSWLASSTLQPVVAAADRIMLIPRRPTPEREVVNREDMATLAMLAPVVVEERRGRSTPGSAAVAPSVIDGTLIAASGASSIAQLLATHVPGMWIWTPSPGSLGATVASLRGASSFGASFPKVYIDGIEVANPIFLAQLAPDQVARIEVIRGPQGGALYGSGAVSGVIQITTRQAAGLTEPNHLDLRSSAGVTESAYSPLGSFVQEHSLSGRVGRDDRSLSGGALVATTGAFIPGAFSRQMQATVGASIQGSGARWQFTARAVSQEAGSPFSPLLPTRAAITQDPAPAGLWGTLSAVSTDAALSWDSTRAQTVREYTLGSTVAFERSGWSHEATAGFDGYTLDNLAVTPGQYRTLGDSALLASAGSANRFNLRWMGSRHFNSGGAAAGVLAFGMEQSSLRDATRGASFAPAAGEDPAIWRHTTGLTAQGELTVMRSLVINAGARVERNSGFTLLSGIDALPTVGVAWRHGAGNTALTVRGSYGRAIQQARVGSRGNPWGGRSPTIAVIEPERQAGFEYGIDLRHGAGAMLSVTRFDQRASNLIQPVVVPGGGGRGLTTRLENIGAIDNRGWEVEGRLSRGALNLTGALGVTSSRVAQLALGYRGDLRQDDRVLQVPARTASLSANWLGRGWSTTATVAHAGDWMNYDWLSLATAPRIPDGETLRSYWLRYPGTTRVGLSFLREVTRAFELVGSVENLLGTQRGEPDNVTVVPGRTVRAGLRARF